MCSSTQSMYEGPMGLRAQLSQLFSWQNTGCAGTIHQLPLLFIIAMLPFEFPGVPLTVKTVTASANRLLSAMVYRTSAEFYFTCWNALCYGMHFTVRSIKDLHLWPPLMLLPT